MIFFQRLNNSNENLMGSVLVVPVVRSETICVPVTWVRFHFVWWKKRKNAHLKTTRKSLKDSSAIFSKSSLTFSCVRRKNRAATTFFAPNFFWKTFLQFFFNFLQNWRDRIFSGENFSCLSFVLVEILLLKQKVEIATCIFYSIVVGTLRLLKLNLELGRNRC